MKRFRVLTAGLLLSSTVFFTVAYATQKQANEVPAPRAHHVIYAEWKVAPDGIRTLDNLRVRDVSATGAWSEWDGRCTEKHHWQK